MSGRNVLYVKGKAKNTLRWELVTPDDFSHANPEPGSLNEFEKFGVVPYCFDYSEKLLIYAVGVDPFRAGQATFHFVYLRENAKGFLKVPLEKFPVAIPEAAQIPTILFSVGRCGSTLLSKLLGVMEVVSISEPDFFTQFALLAPFDADSCRMLVHATDQLLAPFQEQGKRNCVLKMRSQANYAPGQIIGSFPQKPKTIFLTRNFQPWCESVMRVFGSTMESNLAQYIDSLKALRWLKSNTDCLAIQYEDLQNNPEMVCQRLIGFLGIEPAVHDLSEVLSHDSQADSELARTNFFEPLPLATIDAIADMWCRHAPMKLLEELKLTHL